MKHLFYIHSHITYHVSLEVIKHEKIAARDCIFIYGRKFWPLAAPVDIEQVNLPFTHHPTNSFALARKFWRGWRKLAAFDQFVQSLAGEGCFKLYTNQTGIDFIRLFISHRRCAGFSFLEEGMASFYSLWQMNTEVGPAGSSTIFFKTLLLLNFRGRLSPGKWFYDSSYDHAYGVSEASFPDFQRKVLLPFPFYNDSPMPAYNRILVLDATAEYGVTSVKAMLAALEEALQYLAKRGSGKLWVKYHPDQANFDGVKRQYEQVFARYAGRLTIEEMPQYICLELVAGNAYNTQTAFYVFLSSVGIYAAQCGREVHSFASYIARLDEQYAQRVQRLPAVFREKVKFL